MSHLVALLSLLLLFHQHQPPVGVRARPIHRDQTKTTSNAMQNEIKSKNSNKLTSSHWWLVRPSRASRVVDSFVVWRLLNEQNKKKKTKYRLKISTLISVSCTYWWLSLASLVICQVVCSLSCLAIGSRARNLNFSLRFSWIRLSLLFLIFVCILIPTPHSADDTAVRRSAFNSGATATLRWHYDSYHAVARVYSLTD